MVKTMVTSPLLSTEQLTPPTMVGPAMFGEVNYKAGLKRT